MSLHERSSGTAAVYLGSVLPRWVPQSMVDVQTACIEGLFRETHWVEAKKAVGAGPAANEELARDLASFANDGGALLIGVAEDKVSGRHTADGIDNVTGLAQRVEQVAGTRCDPPLYVVPQPLRDAEDASRGVLLVQVPPSASAPHMVGHIYWGRGHESKQRLSDAQVAMLLDRRHRRQLDANHLLDQELLRHPVAQAAVGPAAHGRLLVVARPLSAPDDLLTPLLESEDWPSQLRRLHDAGQDAVPVIAGQRRCDSGEWAELSSVSRRSDGASLHGWHVAQLENHSSEWRPDRLQDLEFRDDGTLRLHASGLILDDLQKGSRWVADASATVLVRRAAVLAGRVGQEAGYLGPWLIATGLHSIGGGASQLWQHDFGHSGLRFPESDYRSHTTASTAELLDRPGAVTRRLFNRLLRTLGSIGVLAPLLTDAE